MQSLVKLSRILGRKLRQQECPNAPSELAAPPEPSQEKKKKKKECF